MIYLDNAATSWPKPECVYQAVETCLRNVGANPGRSGHRLSLEAGRIIEDARGLLASLFGISDPSRLVFTFNATDAINMALKGIIQPGDHVITSAMDHNSVLRPLTGLRETNIISLTVLPATSSGQVTPESVERSIRPDTKVVVLTHASNVVGTINPIEDIGHLLMEKGILFMVDAAQTAGILPIDLGSQCADLMAFSGHKGLLGPQGTGVLYVKPGITLRHWREGGTGNQSEVPLQPSGMPERLEAGTPNTPGIAGLAAGVRYLLERGVDEVRRKEQKSRKILWDHLKSIPHVRVFGLSNPEESIGVVSFVVNGKDPADVADILDRRYGIMVRPGLHCAGEAHRTLGTYPQGTIRIGLGAFTTTDDLEAVRDAIWEISVM